MTTKKTQKIWSPITFIVDVKQTSKYQPSNLIIENKAVSNLNTIANHFKNFFAIIAGEIDKTLELVTPWLSMQSQQKFLLPKSYL